MWRLSIPTTAVRPHDFEPHEPAGHARPRVPGAPSECLRHRYERSYDSLQLRNLNEQFVCRTQFQSSLIRAKETHSHTWCSIHRRRVRLGRRSAPIAERPAPVHGSGPIRRVNCVNERRGASTNTGLLPVRRAIVTCCRATACSERTGQTPPVSRCSSTRPPASVSGRVASRAC